MRCHDDAPANQAEVRQSLRHLSYIRHISGGEYKDSLRVRDSSALSAPTQRAIPADFPRVTHNKNDAMNQLDLTRVDGDLLPVNQDIGTFARPRATRDGEADVPRIRPLGAARA
jgi:hypothetical protein